MKTIITVSELLSMIKKYKKEYEDLYETHIKKENNTNKLLISLYYPSTGITVNGKRTEDKANELKAIDNKILSVLANLQKLLIIKEDINCSRYISIRFPWNEYYDKITVSQALTIKSSKVRDYYIGYLKKLKQDYEIANTTLARHMADVMSTDKIDTYVLAKMNSLNINTTEESVKANYSSFANEYRSANNLEILDPLQISINIDNRLEEAEDFYRRLDVELFNFNATTKIWIDLDLKEDFWGFE